MWEHVKEAFGGIGRQYEYAYPENINDALLELPAQFQQYMKPHYAYKIDISMKAIYKNGSEALFRYPKFIIEAPGESSAGTHHLQKCARDLKRRLTCNDRDLGRDRVEGVAYITCGMWELDAGRKY